MASELYLSSMPLPLVSTPSPSCTPEPPVSAELTPGKKEKKCLAPSRSLTYMLFTLSAGPGDAAGLGHSPDLVGWISGLCSTGLDLRLPVDEEENSK